MPSDYHIFSGGSLAQMYKGYERQAFECIDRGDWDNAIKFAQAVPQNWDIWQRLPNHAMNVNGEGAGPGMPDAAINQILTYLANRHPDDMAGFLFELSQHLPDHTTKETLNRIAHFGMEDYYVKQAVQGHPNWELDEKNSQALKASEFWRDYERHVSAHHFALIKSMFTGKPEVVTDHRGDRASSEFHQHLIPFLKDHANLVQKAVLKDAGALLDSHNRELRLNIHHFKGEPHVRVFRGVAGNYAAAIRRALEWRKVKADEPFKEGEAHIDEDPRLRVIHKSLTVPVAHLSSWSVDPEIAENFASRRIEGHPNNQGVVLTHWMPIKTLLHSGFHTITPMQAHAHASERELVFGVPTGKIKIPSKDFYFYVDDGPDDDSYSYYARAITPPNAITTKRRAGTVKLAKALGEEVLDQLRKSPEVYDPHPTWAGDMMVTSGTGYRPVTRSRQVAPGYWYHEYQEKFGGSDHFLTTAPKVQFGTKATNIVARLFGDLEDGTIHTDVWAVHPEHQGKGLGRLLMAQVLKRYGVQTRGTVSSQATKALQEMGRGGYRFESGGDDPDSSHRIEKSEAAQEDQPLDCHPDAQEIAQSVLRAYEAGTVEPVKLNGKHAAGTLLANDPEDGGAWLLKRSDQGQSPAQGLVQDDATPAVREVVFWQVGKLLGLQDSLNEAGLLVIGGQEIAAIRLLAQGWESLEEIHQENGMQACHNLLHPALESGLVYRWAALDYILGNADRHAGNMMTDGHRIVLIDHGSALAGDQFNPNDPNTFAPFYLRCWVAGNFAKLEPQERYRSIPRPTDQHERMLRAWVEQIPADAFRAKLESYGVDPKPFQARLQALSEHGTVGDYLCRWWAGLHTQPVELQKAESVFDTPEFQVWFQGSKVIGDDGRPQVVYHGTNCSFDRFSASKDGNLGAGMYFTSHPAEAEDYANERHENWGGKKIRSRSIAGPNILPVYLQMRNPYVIDSSRRGQPGIFDFEPDEIKRARERGYDGIIHHWPDRIHIDYTVFHPNQIKSATGNRGTWNPKSPDITKAEPLAKSTWQSRDVFQEWAKFGWEKDREGGKHVIFANRLFPADRPLAVSRADMLRMSVEEVENYGKMIGLTFEPSLKGYRVRPGHPYEQHYRAAGLVPEVQETRKTWTPPGQDWQHVPIEQVQSTLADEQAGADWRVAKAKAMLTQGHALEPIQVERVGDQHMVVDGDDRYHAAKQLGHTHLPVRFNDSLGKSEPLIKMSTRKGLGMFQDYIQPRIIHNLSEADYAVDPDEEIPPKLAEAFVRAPISIHVPIHAIEAVIRDGRIRNQFEVPWSNGMYDPSFRAQAENRLFDIPVKTRWDKRPVYAALDLFHDRPEVSEHHHGPAHRYGSIWLKLKPQVKERATFTPEDSLATNDNEAFGDVHGHHGLPHIARLMSQRSMYWARALMYLTGQIQDTPDYIPGYVEAQIHGGVYLPDDVEEIHVGQSFGKENYLKRPELDEFGRPKSSPMTDDDRERISKTLVEAAQRWNVRLVRHHYGHHEVNGGELTTTILHEPTSQPAGSAAVPAPSPASPGQAPSTEGTRTSGSPRPRTVRTSARSPRR